MDKKALTNLEVIRLVWRIFGGAKELVRGGDFWLAGLIWVLCYRVWSNPGWWDQPISVLPNLLGFTLGGFAIFLGFGSESFKEVISSKNPVKSPYLSVSAAFVVFVMTQCIALLWALVANALCFPVPLALKPFAGALAVGTSISWAIGYFLFIFGIVLAIRASLRIFRLSRWYNDFLIAEVENREAAKAAPVPSEPDTAPPMTPG